MKKMPLDSREEALSGLGSKICSRLHKLSHRVLILLPMWRTDILGVGLLTWSLSTHSIVISLMAHSGRILLLCGEAKLP